MCVIAYKPAELPVNMEVLKHCWDQNSDGAGLMFAENGKLKVAKGFMKWRSLKRYLKRRGLDSLADLPVVFHFRIATHGSVTERNCHPFKINENLAMMHNGVIRNVDNMIGTEDISDSEFFANRYVRDAFSFIGVADLKEGQPINELYDLYIGASKLLFMDNNGEIAIVNERAGTWLKFGLGKDWWFSNTHWQALVKPTKKTTGFQPTVSYEGDFRIVEVWEQGRKVVKKYSKKTGVLHSTSYSQYGLSAPRVRLTDHDGNWLGRGAHYEPDAQKSDTEQEHVGKYESNAFELDDDDWYCIECHAFFSLREAKRSYWVNGLTERIVDCPECGDSNTCEADNLYEKDGDDQVYMCYLCGSESYTDELSISENGSKTCAICNSVNIYKIEEKHLVEQFGADYFDAEVIERRA
jgi:hypothetical protein